MGNKAAGQGVEYRIPIDFKIPCEEFAKVFRVKVSGTDFTDYMSFEECIYNSHAVDLVLQKTYPLDSTGGITIQYDWVPIVNITTKKSIFDRVRGCYVVTEWDKK